MGLNDEGKLRTSTGYRPSDWVDRLAIIIIIHRYPQRGVLAPGYRDVKYGHEARAA